MFGNIYTITAKIYHSCIAKDLRKILVRGTLSTALLKKIGERPSRDRLVFEYAKLAVSCQKHAL